MFFFVATPKRKSPQNNWSWPQRSHKHVHPKAHTYPTTQGGHPAPGRPPAPLHGGPGCPHSIVLTTAEHWGDTRDISTNGAAGCNPSSWRWFPSSFPHTEDRGHAPLWEELAEAMSVWSWHFLRSPQRESLTPQVTLGNIRKPGGGHMPSLSPKVCRVKKASLFSRL